MSFGDRVDVAQATDMIAMAIEHGVSVIDTANAYNDGDAERVLGKALRNVARPELMVTSKVGNAYRGAPPTGRLAPDTVRRELRASLERLERDHLDVYFLHSPDRSTPVEQTLSALAGLVADGLVHAVGQSNYAAWQVVEMHAICDRRGWPKPLFSQQMYNLLARRADDEYLEASAHLGLVDWAYNPLAGGLLTGKHDAAAPPRGGRFSSELYRRRYWNAAQFDAVARARSIAADTGLSLIELSLRWLRDRPHVDAVLIGASDADQLRTNLEALAGPALDAGITRRCDELWAALHGAAPKYNR